MRDKIATACCGRDVMFLLDQLMTDTERAELFCDILEQILANKPTKEDVRQALQGVMEMVGTLSVCPSEFLGEELHMLVQGALMDERYTQKMPCGEYAVEGGFLDKGDRLIQ